MNSNPSGISVYSGIKDKSLANTYGNELGKTRVTGYCIQFISLKDINLDILKKLYDIVLRQQIFCKYIAYVTHDRWVQ